MQQLGNKNLKNSVRERIKTTKSGKVSRRAMGLGHCRSKKRSTQLKRRKLFRSIKQEQKNIQKYASR